MDNKGITFADALDSLNRIDSMMDDFLLNLERWSEVNDKGSLLFFLIEDYERNIHGDESIGVYGLKDVARFIINDCNRPLANKLFSIGAKNTKADELIKSFSEFWNPSFQFIGTLSELYFKIDSVNNEILFAKDSIGIQETNHSENDPNPETGDNIDVIDEDGEDESSDDVDDEISLPLAMDTEKARCIFTAAYNEQWMNGNNTIGYTWIGFGNIHQRTGRTVSCTNKLAYLCHKIYEPSTPPWREIGYFFNLERLDRDWSNIKDLIADVKRPSWMNTIDHLIRNYRY